MKINSVAFGMWMAAMAAISPATAQVTLTGTEYREDFNQIGANGLPPGWSVRTNANAGSLGIEASFNSNPASWSATSGQFANFASTTNNQETAFAGTETASAQSTATNRCLGVRQTSAVGDPGGAFVLQLANTLGLRNVRLNLDLNLLSVQGRSTTWTMDYGLGAEPATFTPVETFTDPGVFGTTRRTVEFGAALDNQSETVWIRIVALDASSGGGSRDTFGIDNVVLNYEPVDSVALPPLSIQMIGADAVLTWTNAAFALQSAPSVQGTFTNIPGAASPCTNPVTGGAAYFRLRAE